MLENCPNPEGKLVKEGGRLVLTPDNKFGHVAVAPLHTSKKGNHQSNIVPKWQVKEDGVVSAAKRMRDVFFFFFPPYLSFVFSKSAEADRGPFDERTRPTERRREMDHRIGAAHSLQPTRITNFHRNHHLRRCMASSFLSVSCAWNWLC